MMSLRELYKSCPPALPDTSDDEFQIELLPQDAPTTFRIKGQTSFPRLPIDVPSAWINKELESYFWKNCNNGKQKYGFPADPAIKFDEKPRTNTKFIKKSRFMKQGDKISHNDIELFSGMSTDELVEEAWKRLKCNNIKENRRKSKKIKKQPTVEVGPRHEYQLPEPPTHRRCFKPIPLKRGLIQRPNWGPLGADENLDFFPPISQQLQGFQNETILGEYADIHKFQHMSTEELLELNWDLLSKETNYSDSDEEEEEENQEEDMSEVDAYLDYHSSFNIPEKIPRMSMKFCRNGSYTIDYQTPKPKPLKKKECNSYVHTKLFKIFLYMYKIITMIYWYFSTPEIEEAPQEEPQVVEPTINKRMEVSISNISRKDFTCKFRPINDPKIICTNHIKINDFTKKPILLIASDCESKQIIHTVRGDHPAKEELKPVVINISLTNGLTLDHLYMSSHRWSGVSIENNSPGVTIGVIGEIGRKLELKYLGDEVIYDRTIIAVPNDGYGNKYEVVAASELEEVEEMVIEKMQDSLVRLPKELPDITDESKFIEVAFGNDLNLPTVVCFCTFEEYSQIIIRIPATCNEVNYKIGNPKIMTYHQGNYNLSNPTLENCYRYMVNITLKNLSLKDFDHCWKRFKYHGIRMNTLMIKHLKKDKIKVLFRDDEGNYKIDDLCAALPVEECDRDRRRRISIFWGGGLYRSGSEVTITHEAPYTITIITEQPESNGSIKVELTDGITTRDFLMQAEENSTWNNQQLDIKLINGLRLSDITHSAVTYKQNVHKNLLTSTLILSFLEKARCPILVELCDSLSSERILLANSSGFDYRVNEEIKTVNVVFSNGIEKNKVSFMVTEPVETPINWETKIFMCVSDDTKDSLVVWLVGSKEIMKTTIDRQEDKHFIATETLQRSGAIHPDTSQAHLIIFLKRISLANASITCEQYDKNAPNDTIILKILTKARVPIKLMVTVEDEVLKECTYCTEEVKTITSMEVKIIKGFYLRDINITINKITLDDELTGQEVTINVANPNADWIAMIIDEKRDIARFYKDDMTKAEEEAKEIRLDLSDALKSRLVRYFWEPTRILEKGTVFRIIFACSTKINVRLIPVCYTVENTVEEGNLKEQNLKAVDNLLRLQRSEDLIIPERKLIPEVMIEENHLYNYYFKGDAAFYKKLYFMYEGWKHGVMDDPQEDSSEGYCSIDGDGDQSEEKEEPPALKRYQRGLPMVGFVQPLLTLTQDCNNVLPYQRCDLLYARYLAQYYKDEQNGDESEYCDYSSGEEEDLESVIADQALEKTELTPDQDLDVLYYLNSDYALPDTKIE